MPELPATAKRPEPAKPPVPETPKPAAEPKEAAKAAPVKAAKPKLRMHQLNFQDGSALQLAPPECHPGLPIADQNTAAGGIWAKVAGGDWHKTEVPGTKGAMRMALDHPSAADALAALLAAR
jgi:hypothetical protein